MKDNEVFRQEIRQWIAANYPTSLRAPVGDEEELAWGGKRAHYDNPDVKLWLDRMAARGFTVPTWPKDYGGAGLSKEETMVLVEELKAQRCRPALLSFGIMMLGPVLLEYGTEAQKREHLPKIARGEIRWCQGYSEPGAGSDLAGLQTRCEDKGDHWLVNGQKIWTSYANYADWIFALVRTDTTRKHDGISFVLIDMETPGVSTKPIKLISGASPFCQTFFDNVKVPKNNLVGELNKGWTIAKRLLQHERSAISSGAQSGLGGTPGGKTLAELAKDYRGVAGGRLADPALRDQIVRHTMNSHAFALTLRRAAEEGKQGHGPSAASSMFKYYGSEQNKRKFELMIETMGTAALGWEGEGFSEEELDITRQWLRSKANSIEGGTTEVQLNVVAKRVLGLPD